MSRSLPDIDSSKAKPEPAAVMGTFERYLSVWVLLCMGAGIFIGHFAPTHIVLVSRFEVAHVNIVIAMLIWVMIVPMLVKIDFGALRHVAEHWRGVGVTVAVNWLVKPFSMALLAWLFIRHAFAAWLPADQLDSYTAGLILLAAAPCTAMVFVWSQLCKGDAYFTLSQVALNDAIMVIAFAPIVALLLGVSAIAIPWETLLVSVAVYILIPVAIAQGLRRALLRRNANAPASAAAASAPYAMGALLATLVLLFAFQADVMIEQPVVIGLLAVPIVIQVMLNAGLAYVLNRRLGVAHCVAGPSSLIAASNFFELAVATAISVFGLRSGAALATVVGVLVEVPLMLVVVRVVNRTQSWYERKRAA
ncbi:ACR3 family arsenite efflux transporter [Pandoraea fibrosis]|uniref:ACR3 family arsenite efflux transporter n=1 Tax=Pandoraea fibrosis TaxID=1891094 RepID=A0ABX6HUI0_9BURK|nr:ACR3 family arsenite efflux transporter [Pandoraea fibrosis]QHE92524.1 ACR3 family arsenite efflux transporter [Pandoraea fibrosis]QHF13920.1 ACR3 family arsenite efflux transporter [Pandoraea fibrosis]